MKHDSLQAGTKKKSDTRETNMLILYYKYSSHNSIYQSYELRDNANSQLWRTDEPSTENPTLNTCRYKIYAGIYMVERTILIFLYQMDILNFPKKKKGM